MRKRKRNRKRKRKEEEGRKAGRQAGREGGREGKSCSFLVVICCIFNFWTLLLSFSPLTSFPLANFCGMFYA